MRNTAGNRSNAGTFSTRAETMMPAQHLQQLKGRLPCRLALDSLRLVEAEGPAAGGSPAAPTTPAAGSSQDPACACCESPRTPRGAGIPFRVPSAPKAKLLGRTSRPRLGSDCWLEGEDM